MSAFTLASLEGLRALPPDWAGPGTVPPDRTAVRMAMEVVRAAAGIALRRGYAWVEPQIAPDAEGGIDLFWGTQAETIFLLTLAPRHVQEIRLRVFRRGTKTQDRPVALSEAAEEAAMLFPDEPPASPTREEVFLRNGFDPAHLPPPGHKKPKPVAAEKPWTGLLPEEVVLMRWQYWSGELNQREIARERNMSWRYVQKIVNGLAWQDAGGPTAPLDRTAREG